LVPGLAVGADDQLGSDRLAVVPAHQLERAAGDELEVVEVGVEA
jgi:hypothetical protein